MLRKLAVCLILIAFALSSMAVDLDSDADDSDIHPAYDSLTEKQKVAYDSFKRAVTSFSLSSPIVGLDADQAEEVMYALESDYPELFWIDDCYSVYYYIDTGQATEFKSKEAIDRNEVERKTAELDSVVSGFVPDTGSRAELIRSIHDWIALKITYDLSTDDSGNVYGALVEERARCAGYAYAFNYLCKLNGIPSIYLAGSVKDYDAPHAWNIVKMDDGKWYYVDVTWDDTGCPTVVRFDYFLIGSDTYVNSGTFSTDRTPYNDYSITSSSAAYGYSPYATGYGSDCICLEVDDVLSNSTKRYDFYYEILDSKLNCDAESMLSIYQAMKNRNAEIWSFALTVSEATQLTDLTNPKDYSIRMFLDETEVTPDELGISGDLSLELPGYGALYRPVVYDLDGQKVYSGMNFPLIDTGSYTVVYEEFDLLSNPVVIVIALIIILALIAGIVRNHKAGKRRRNARASRAAGTSCCPQCGSDLSTEDTFCIHCGCKIK